MKKILIATALAGLSTTSALAADLAVKAPVYAKAPVAVPYNWTGFYLGANAGGSVGRSKTNISNPGGSLENETTYLSPAGAIGGGQIGYNWQTNLAVLGTTIFGLEADIQGSGQTTSECIGNCRLDGVTAINVQQKMDWFGTVRGRVGIANGPALGYLTGGYAYGNVNTNGVFTGGAIAGVPFSQSETRGGFVLGSGVEASLGGNWTGKIEYLYVDLGTQTQVIPTTGNAVATNFGNPLTVSSRVRDNIFRGGINYRLGGNSTYSEPVKNWTGLYAGGNFGSLTARNQSAYSYGNGAAFIGGANNQSFSLMPDGYAGGVQIGYNWQSAAWVFGLEADIQGATSKDDRTCVTTCRAGVGLNSVLVDGYRQTVPYFGTVRGRLGYSSGSTLFYGTAGFAYGETKTTISKILAATSEVVSINNSKGGYALGAGIESPFTLLGLLGPSWTIKSEYLFVDLGRNTVSFPNTTGIVGVDTFTTRTQEHIMRTGINYHFNAPVVAKY